MKPASARDSFDRRDGGERGAVQRTPPAANSPISAHPEDADICEVLKLEASQVRAIGAIGSFHEHGAPDRPELLGRFGIPAPSMVLDELLDAAKRCRTARRGDDRRAIDAPVQIWGQASRRLTVSRIGAIGPQGYIVVTYLFAEDDVASRVSPDAVSPPASAYFRLWLRNRAHERDLSGLGAALDATSPAVFVLDRGKRLLFSNETARALVSREDGLRQTGQSLAATALDDALLLQVTLDHMANADGRSSSSGCSSSFQLRRKGVRRPLIATASAVPHTPLGDTDPAIILHVIDPATDIGPALLPACDFYRLSPVEARLTVLIATGIALTDAARTLRIKEPTARSYLKQVFIKTDTRRQADLVRVMLSSLIHMAPNGSVASC